MESNVKIENIKNSLDVHKKMLDNAYNKNDYSGITEEAEKIVKLSYAIYFLLLNSNSE